jgi:hypothetical protein
MEPCQEVCGSGVRLGPFLDLAGRDFTGVSERMCCSVERVDVLPRIAEAQRDASCSKLWITASVAGMPTMGWFLSLFKLRGAVYQYKNKFSLGMLTKKNFPILQLFNAESFCGLAVRRVVMNNAFLRVRRRRSLSTPLLLKACTFFMLHYNIE